jgi:hypothetical protein
MTEAIATWIWIGVGGYALAGLVVAVLLMAGGFRAFDATAAASPWRFKLMIAPGLIALWPVLVARLAGWTPAEDRP